jgi:hypothetical protein
MLRCFDSCRVIFYLRFVHMFIFPICHLAVSITLILRLIYLGISSCVYNCVNILVCEITFRKPNTFIFCLCKITFETWYNYIQVGGVIASWCSCKFLDVRLDFVILRYVWWYGWFSWDSKIFTFETWYNYIQVVVVISMHSLCKFLNWCM